MPPVTVPVVVVVVQVRQGSMLLLVAMPVLEQADPDHLVQYQVLLSRMLLVQEEAGKVVTIHLAQELLIQVTAVLEVLVGSQVPLVVPAL
jgi:hypothetical protein